MAAKVTEVRSGIIVNHRSNCRLCNSEKLDKLLKLKSAPLTDDFKSAESETEFMYDIDIYECSNCKIVQTLHDVDMTNYYFDYQYAVGASNSARQFMQGAAESLKAKYFKHHTRRPKLLEIGSGDGTQLKFFQDVGFDVLGYEPSLPLVVQAEKIGVKSVQGLFGCGSMKNIPETFQELDVIFMSYTFDHMPDPLETLRECRKLLSNLNGYVVVEIHDLEAIFDRGEYCLFEHEHSIYLDSQSIGDFFQYAGFELVDLDLVPQAIRRANSLIAVGKVDQKSNDVGSENKYNVNRLRDYTKLNERVNKATKRLNDYILKEKRNGIKLAAYGAGGRGVMMLANCESAKYIDAMYDQNPKGKDIFAPKSRIEVLSSSLITENSFEKIIIFSFGYYEEIRNYLSEIGYHDNQIISLMDIICDD